jgi:hypothetical protein
MYMVAKTTSALHASLFFFKLQLEVTNVVMMAAECTLQILKHSLQLM